MRDLTIQYINIYVSDLTQSVVFYRDVVGLDLEISDEAHGYASFNAGSIRVWFDLGGCRSERVDRASYRRGLLYQ